MKTMRLSSPPVQTTTLHDLLDQLLRSFRPTATKNGCQLLNDVTESITIHTDEQVLSSIIGDVLHTVISNAKDSNIRISAKVYSNIIVLHVKDQSSFNNYAVSAGLQKLQPLAEKIGGYLDITSYRLKETTIAFSFLNLEEVIL